MRQQILRIVCDGCGLIAQWEILNHEPLVSTLYPQEMVERQGWHTVPKEGGRFSPYDLCEKCHAINPLHEAGK